ncbi:MAG: RNA polymerase sigma factor, partial [Steroidobacteraceae bacterium]
QRRFGPDDAEPVLDTLPSNETNVAGRIDAWSLLMHLTPRARAVMILHEVEGYTHREIADLFDQSESYSKSILARALQRLEHVAASNHPQETCRHG